MDALHLGLALVPLGAYLVALGAIHLLGRPRLVTGARDTVLLGTAASGLIVAGPMELFLPEAAAATFGPWVWLLMIGLYAMSVLFLALVQRPRLVVYNFTARPLRRLLEELTPTLDPDAHWSGDVLLLPRIGVHLAVEPFGTMRTTTLVAVGARQDLNGWAELRRTLRTSLAPVRVGANPRGYSFLAFGALMLSMAVWRISADPQQLVQQARDMLRL